MSFASQDALARMFGLIGPQDSEDAEPEGPPDFDGGAREPAPAPSDPEAEHGATIVALFQNQGDGGGRW